VHLVHLVNVLVINLGALVSSFLVIIQYMPFPTNKFYRDTSPTDSIQLFFSQ
jgi:hypothetical protein